MIKYLRFLQGITCFLIIVLALQCCKEKPTETTTDTVEKEAAQNDEFTVIFDGETLNNWKGDPNYWRVENGNIVGEITPETILRANTFLIYSEDEPADFDLKAEFRISENGNSGINYRSEQLDTIPFALRGYQADIDGKNRYTGQNYEERKRTTLAYRGEKAEVSSQPNPDTEGSLRANVEKNAWQSRQVLESLGHMDSLKTNIRQGDWNEIYLIVKGNRMQHFVNDILMSEIIDNDTVNRKTSGKLGFQVHVGPPMKVEYRNVKLKNL